MDRIGASAVAPVMDLVEFVEGSIEYVGWVRIVGTWVHLEGAASPVAVDSVALGKFGERRRSGVPSSISTPFRMLLLKSIVTYYNCGRRFPFI